MSTFPNWLGQATALPLVVANTGLSSATAGNGVTAILTPSTILQPGTYWVGGNFSLLAGTTFTASDSVYFRIYDTAATLTAYPQTLMTGYTATGNTPAAIVVTVSGLIVLTTAGTLSWGVNCAFTLATGKTAYVTNAFYQRLS